jgi:ribosomal protein S18 acetylase RimI-like enzyme
MATTAIQIRRLTYADLPQVISVERRAFPTPWSLAMFVLELSKPGGVCLAAGMRRRYYQDNGEDAVIMWRTPHTLEGRLDDVPNARPPR